jgi:hypothetical protein
MLRTLVALLIPQILVAQYAGVSLGRTSSTVDWQVPPPPSGCNFCVSDISPNAHREALAPAFVLHTRPAALLGLSTELRYVRKGYATTQPTLNVHYLEIPVLLRVGSLVTARSPVTPFLEAGPALAFRAHCEVDYNGLADDCRKGAAFGQDWRIRGFDVSSLIGVGLAIRLPGAVLAAGGRIDWGFVNIGGGQGVPTKNRSSVVYLAWLWQVGHHSA